jgi:PmbA protein
MTTSSMIHADKELAQYCIDRLLAAGADKSQCVLTLSEKSEFNVANDAISLLRTTLNADVSLTALVEGRKGSLVINQLEREALDAAAKEVVELARNSQPDEANDIAEAVAPKSFESGDRAPDLERMHERLSRFLGYVKERYPRTGQEEVQLDFTTSSQQFSNSNGVDFAEREGLYSFSTFFTSREGTHSSSFNYTGFKRRALDTELFESGSVDRLLRESGEQIVTKGIGKKFVGKVVIAPDCLPAFLGSFAGFLGDMAMISGTSIYKDSIGEPVADPCFSLHCRPRSDEIAAGYAVTRDGFEAQDCSLVEGGVLRSHLLGLYGSRKTGKERAANHGGAFVIDGGASSFDEMIAGIDEGLVLGRFSGGRPSSNGDFTGVAKNSYYVKGGKVAWPISEVMISGNIAQMLKDIDSISAERIDYGDAILPWICVHGISVSG